MAAPREGTAYNRVLFTDLSFTSCTPFYRVVPPPPSVHKCKTGNAELTAYTLHRGDVRFNSLWRHN